MLQHLLRRLVFDVPILNEFAKMPLKVRASPLQLAYFRALPTALLYALTMELFSITSSGPLNLQTFGQQAS